MYAFSRQREDVRQRIAREAAKLLYSCVAHEYKQAKEMAAKALGYRLIPSNAEVAQQLDKLIDEVEGAQRDKLLVEMRRDALSVMEALKDFNPRLIGSVWRGLAHKGSDIDIEVFCEDPQRVVNALISAGYPMLSVKEVVLPHSCGEDVTIQILTRSLCGFDVEVLVRPSDWVNKVRFCDIFGDRITGLTLQQLKRVLSEDPLRRFIPT